MNQLKHLTNITDPPEAIRMCLNCRRAECTGKCAAVIEARRARSTKHKGKVPKRHKANGQIHTVKEWAKITGISADLLHARMREGMTMAEAIAYGTPRTHLYIAYGRAQLVKDWSSETGIPQDTLRYRMRVMGMTLEQAIEMGQARRR